MFRYLIFKHKNQKFQEFPFWVHEGFIILLLLYCKLKIKKKILFKLSSHNTKCISSLWFRKSYVKFARMCFKIQHRSFAQIGLFIV